MATGKPAFSSDVSTHSESFVQLCAVRVMDGNPALSRLAASGGCQNIQHFAVLIGTLTTMSKIIFDFLKRLLL